MSRYPELRDELQGCLAGLDLIHGGGGVDKPPAQLGDFRILREVGRGGMGAVYEAEQISLGRRVALKVMRFAGLADTQSVERLQREAETVARLHHTNIVPIFSVGCEHGINYYAMQFIDSRSLADVFADHSREIDPRQLAEWGLQAAEALEHATSEA